MGDTYDEQAARNRAELWMRRFTDGLSPEGRAVLEELRCAERSAARGEASEHATQGALDSAVVRLALPEAEAEACWMACRVGPFSRVLSRTVIAEDDGQLEAFAELPFGERETAALVLGIGEADTVEGALEDYRARKRFIDDVQDDIDNL